MEEIQKYGLGYGTVHYRALEVLLGSSAFSFPMDLWSIGCILAELATRDYLFKGQSVQGHVVMIFSAIGFPVDDEVLKCLSKLPLWSPQWPPFQPAGASRCHFPSLG